MPRSPVRAFLAFIAVVVLAAPLGAQEEPPVYHGVLEVLPAAGTIDRLTGAAVLKVRRWRLRLRDTSNGIAPDAERLLIAVGQGGANDLFLPPGTLVAHRRGRVFRYRAPRGSVTRGISAIKIVQRSGEYRLSFTLVGVELSPLLFDKPLCMPIAVIVGDDDGFSGIEFNSPSFTSRRISVPRSCKIDPDDWPWLGG
ncbi:MAG TPA: hypothetical protein VKA21_11655 [Candidatus Binatia bacterium]|nr:hypothetical protein [Candidatus Binatia bacterium]